MESDVLSKSKDLADQLGPCAIQPDFDEPSYFEDLCTHIQDSEVVYDKLKQWCHSTPGPSLPIQDHVVNVLRDSGVPDYDGRVEAVQRAVLRHKQLLIEKKSRKRLKDRLKDAAHAMKAIDDKAEEAAGKAKCEVDTKEDSDMELERPMLGLSWTKVQDFKTQDEALRFIVECQPFDYRPLYCFCNGEGFPRFDSSGEAFAYVQRMRLLPSEFVSVDGEFKRRLRIRKLESGNGQDSLSTRHARRTGRGNPSRARRMSLSEVAMQAKEIQGWVVESAGVLFEKPRSIRELSGQLASARYFIAVSPEVERKVMAEGFRVGRRCSIPCSATPKAARDVFNAHSESRTSPNRLTSETRVSVLAVSLPPELGVDVVTHKSGGFLIRCKELPAHCFSRVRRIGGDGS